MTTGSRAASIIAICPPFAPQSQRQKVKVNDLKLQQAEETFATAKQLFDELTDDLYEELPTFYDRFGLTNCLLLVLDCYIYDDPCLYDQGYLIR